MPRPNLYTAALLLLAPTSVFAAALALTDVPDPQHIYGGSETEQCAWPSVAYLSHGNGACTGALIHPQIVLTAAHCVPGDVSATVRFGERANTAVELAATEFCRANPEFFNTADGTDYAFCKLATPVTNIPVIPIAFGCEQSILGPGRSVTHVGYGNDQNGDSGRKKFVSLPVTSVTPAGEIITGQGGDGICSGDSGGPVMAKLEASVGGDDTWRVVGIHSWAQMGEPGECGGAAGSVIAWRAVEFIEQESGVDITPCFTPDGTWDPTWGCQGFPIDPAAGGEGSYNAMCATGPLGEFSAMCGAPLSDFPDDDPPSLNVLSPTGDQVFEVDMGGQAALVIEAEADDGDGWGVAGVELQIVPEDGDMVTQVLAYPPYRWSTNFPVGGYNLKLIASDHAGNVTESDWIAIGVGTEAPSTPPGGDESSSGGDEATSDDGGTTGEPAIGDTSTGDETGASQTSSGGEGCGCSSASSRSPADLLACVLTAFALSGAAARRRRTT